MEFGIETSLCIDIDYFILSIKHLTFSEVNLLIRGVGELSGVAI